jgi:hypothetical protein
MTSSIDRLAVRWRPDAVPDEAARLRLDALVSAVREDDALASAVPGDALVCVRRVEVAHRMRWDLADAELVADWAAALAAAVRAAAASVSQRGADVVRYPHRAALRADVVASVLCGDHDRVWAWRLLGLPSAGVATTTTPVASSAGAARVLQAVVAEAVMAGPAAVVALVVAAVRARRLASLVDVLTERVVVALAEQVWADAGGSTPDAARPRAFATPADRISGARAERTDPLLALVGKRSEIARAAGVARPGGAANAPVLSVEAARAMAMFAVLEVEPNAARRPDAATTVAMLAHVLAAGEPGPEDHREPERSPAAGGPAARRAHDPDPATALIGRPGGATSWGGLLFLLPLVADIGLPDRALAGPALRPLLYELARTLLIRAVPEHDPGDDPALLAFCGLAPDADPPDRPDETARAALRTDADALVAALAERLGRDDDDRVLLLATARRAAVIEADPGWIDVRLDLDEVTLEVRRAGLDLDPGYLPWLGCVVRFRYE